MNGPESEDARMNANTEPANIGRPTLGIIYTSDGDLDRDLQAPSPMRS